MTIKTDEEALAVLLREGVVYRENRWSGDTHADLGGSIDEAATNDLMLAAATEIDRLTQRLAAVDGWQLVPREPTAAMMDAPEHQWAPEARQVWTAMLAAAPSRQEG